jgi:hypothetical protein
MPRSPQQEQRLATFCDLIADGCSIAEASRRIGVLQQSGSAMFKRVCRDLGEQAK